MVADVGLELGVVDRGESGDGINGIDQLKVLMGNLSLWVLVYQD